MTLTSFACSTKSPSSIMTITLVQFLAYSLGMTKAMMDTPTTCIRVTSSIPIQTEDNPARQGSTSVSEYENLEFQITSV